MPYEHQLNSLESSEGSVRMAAIGELRAQLPESLRTVLEAVASPNWQVRESAVQVLDHAEQSDEVEAALRRAANDHAARVRRSALHSLSCGRCKPDGCVASDTLELIVDALLHDPSIRLRRKLAGDLMWGQQGRDRLIVEAFRQLLVTETDRVLRQRAATFLASCDLPRESPYREWIGAWERRIADLLATS